MKPFLFIIAMAALCGCSSAPKAAYQTEATTDAAVTSAMGAWGNYVAVYHPPVSQEKAVKAAFEKVQQSELVAIDATTVYVMATSTNSTASTASEAIAIADVGTDVAALLNLTAQFESSTNKP